MKITATQLRRIIREETERVLEDRTAVTKATKGAPPKKTDPREGDVYYGKLKRTPIEINVELVSDGTVYFTQFKSGDFDEMEMTLSEFQTYLADPRYGFEFSHRQQW